ncbi:phytanoyl-CoA dioxygenase family protein [Spirosoma rhododendri]|uniref:Phytanoyl-CoA dioxygenase family protein n=1 Tax=Spirosoma rhododendri TaxID=2728024 RepID=A0A7L5DJT0_9BACT|nr:phytanoyl-CoA dioxygenase family protein [Spirosoma rhododendri]QJD77731.1 phytanoyl-CoA dioxygenase family protein [Spirosoma rhododendri]
MTSTSTAINLPWTESPFFAQELQNTTLSPEQAEQARRYSEDGFLIFDPQIDPTILEAALTDVDPLYKGELRLQDGWRTVPAVQQIAAAPRIMETLRMLYRREPIPFQTLNFPVGTQQRTHSDSIHFNSIPQRFMCGVWVALEDVSDGNGPLHYYPGSHRLPFYDLIDLGLKGSEAQTVEEIYGRTYKEYEERLDSIIQAQGLKKAILNMKKGMAIIWSANLLHGGEKILTPGSTRHSQVTHYFFENCVYYTPLRSDATIDKLYVRKITNIATGQPVDNKYFDQSLAYEAEGYAKRYTIPLKIRQLGRFVPGFLIRMVKK